MDKINKTKKILIYSLIAAVVLTIIFSTVDHIESYSFKKWVFSNFVSVASPKMTMDEPGVAIMIVTIVLTIAIWGLFVGSGFKYSKSKMPRVQGRKWPYIVMLIFGSISAIYGAYSQSKTGHGVISMGSTVPSDIQKAVIDKLNADYSIIRVVNIITIILSAAIAGLSIGMLLMLDKAKKDRDLQMTMGVIQTGIDENKANEAQQPLPQHKDAEENDLP